MPIYQYRCDNCGAIADVKDTLEPDRRVDWEAGKIDHIREVDTPCGTMRRIYSFSYITPMPEHYNMSVGKVVSSNRQFRDELRRSSEELEERTGIPHSLVPVDPADMKDFQVDDSGLKETHDAMVRGGTKAPTGNTVWSFKPGS